MSTNLKAVTIACSQENLEGRSTLYPLTIRQVEDSGVEDSGVEVDSGVVDSVVDLEVEVDS